MKKVRKSAVQTHASSRHFRNLVRPGHMSLLTLAILGVSGSGLAQQAPAGGTQSDVASTSDKTSDNLETVIVLGVREAIAAAQKTKRDADTVVDSISADDLGSFPDKSASDALQRLPGLNVNRLQSNDDSTHPSAEPAAVLIRGLTQVRTEFNGRDSFSADASRGLNFNDISPELMAGIDSYKNATAEMIEGGIAGTVNLRTRLPLDSSDQLVSGSVKANYGDRGK